MEIISVTPKIEGMRQRRKYEISSDDFRDKISSEGEGLMNRLKPYSVGIIVVILVGCSAAPTKFVFRSNESPEEKIHYISTGSPSFVMAIPGVNWNMRAVDYNHAVLTATSGPRRIVNIFEYSDGSLHQRFYKPGTSEEQALKEYFRIESEHHLSQNPGSTNKIISQNIPGINKPNLLWQIKWANQQTVWLTTSRDNHLIVVSWQGLDPPLVGEKRLEEIFRSLRFISEEEEKIILQTLIVPEDVGRR